MEWKEVTLGEIMNLVIDYRGKTPLKLGSSWSDSGYRALSAKNIKTGQIVAEDSIRFVDEQLYRKWMKDEVKRGDILITSEAPFGQIFYWDSDEKIVLSQRLFDVRLNDEVCHKYVYYFMTSHHYQKDLEGRATGTTVTGLRQPELLKSTILLPPLSAQRSIASILSSLDRKIELNNKINADLEEMAQAIFKNWFVDFEPFKDGKFVDSELGMIPEGWKVGTLDEIFSLKYGKNLSTSMILEKGDYPVYGANGIIGYYNEYNCDKYSVLVTSRGNGSGDVSRTHHPKSFITNNSFVVEPLEQYKYIELPFINGLFNIIDFKSYCSGSAQPQLTNKAMRNICIISPPMEIVIKYCEMLETLFSHIECVIAENSHLSLLRDTLLPRLMSGELEVPE